MVETIVMTLLGFAVGIADDLTLLVGSDNGLSARNLSMFVQGITTWEIRLSAIGIHTGLLRWETTWKH